MDYIFILLHPEFTNVDFTNDSGPKAVRPKNDIFSFY